MNIWIQLGDAKDDDAVETRELLATMVDRGLIFCPVSDGVIWELYRQAPDSALRVAAVMDQLSLGACFASKKRVRRAEILRYVRAVIDSSEPIIALGVSDLFVPISGYLGPNPSLVFPPGWSSEDVERCVVGIEDKLRELTLSDLVHMRAGELPWPERRNPPYRECRRRRAEFARGSAKRARRVEEEYVAREHVIPLINSIPIAERIAFLAKMGERPPDPHGGLMGDLQRSARALRAEIDTHFETGRDPERGDKIQDFFDIEFLIVPRAYSHLLAARDKWIRDLMTGRLKSAEGPIFAGSLAELRSEISRIVVDVRS